MSGLNNRIKALANQYEQELIAFRRDLHQYPELGYKEYKTAEKIADRLKKLNIEVETEVGGTGVIGIIRGREEGRTIMLRADMDALKISEENDVDYQSVNEGIMHACGHDVHVTWLLGAAMILNNLKEEFKGNVKVIFQPAEEGLGGAGKMIEDGVMENPKVDAVIGAHVWPDIEAGSIGVKDNALMASPSLFTLKIYGEGGHGAQPHTTIDPIAIGCQVYMSLQTILSRKIDPTHMVALSITEFHGGSSHNIIPSEVYIRGTARTLTKETEEQMPELMESIIKGIVESHGGRYEFNYNTYYPSVVNNKEMTDLVRRSAYDIIGKDHVCEIKKPTMTGEDFSFYLNKVPGTFFFIGTRNEDKGIIYPLHNKKFDVDESIISTASALFSKCAMEYLNE